MTRPDAAIRSYLDHLTVERGVSPHTSAAYRRDLRRYAAYLDDRGVGDLDAVDALLVGSYQAELAEGVPGPDKGWVHRPLAAASVARAVVAVRNLHRFALAEGLTATDPTTTVHPPHPPRRLPKALTVAEVEAILEVPATDTALGLRDRALLELLYGTGARITEAVSLDVDEVARAIDLGSDPSVTGSEPVPPGSEPALNGSDPSVPGSGAALRVLGKGSKERMIPLGSFARAALEAYLVRGRPVLAARGRGDPALFLNARGSRLSRQSAWTVLQATAGRAGLTVDVSPHTLRHSFATHLLDGGADVRVVQELLGHASVTTTQIYTLVTVDHLREVYLGAHPRAY